MPGDPLRLLAVGNGRSIHTVRWAQRLVERGHAVHLVTDLAGDEIAAIDGVTVHDVRTLELLTRVRGLRRLRFGPAIRRLADRLRVDVVHAHGILPYAHWAAEADVHPLVVSPWGRDVLIDARREPGRRRARRAFAAADHLVVNSRAILDASLEVGADPTRVLHAIWHTRLEGFSPERAERDRLRSELGWPSDALVVLSLRTFQERTNIDVLVRAFDRARRGEPRARLLLAARGGQTRREIETLVARLGLGELVRFHRVGPEELPPLVASADVTVSIADTDSSPSSLLEAMASGQPMVGGWCPSIDEWIAPGEGAEMVPPKDEDAVADALLRLLRDPALRREYGRRNAAVVRTRVEEAGPALEALYRDLAARHATRPRAATHSRVRVALYWARKRWWPRYGPRGLVRRPVHRLRWGLLGPARIAPWVDRRLQMEGYFWLFLCGVTNSGTTILARVIGSHPEVRVLPTEGQWLTGALPLEREYGVRRESTKRLDVFHLTEESDPAPALRMKYDWSYHFERRPGIALEKSTPNALRTRWLQANFRPSRFIGIVRHPYAACEGIRRRTGMEIEAAARQWARANEVMLDDGERLERFLLVTYEDLTERPEEELERLQRFLDLETPFDRAALDSPLDLHNMTGRPSPLQNFNLKSVERLSSEEMATIDRVAGPVMARLGYAPFSAEDAESSFAARAAAAGLAHVAEEAATPSAAP